MSCRNTLPVFYPGERVERRRIFDRMVAGESCPVLCPVTLADRSCPDYPDIDEIRCNNNPDAVLPQAGTGVLACGTALRNCRTTTLIKNPGAVPLQAGTGVPACGTATRNSDSIPAHPFFLFPAGKNRVDARAMRIRPYRSLFFASVRAYIPPDIQFSISFC